MTQTEITQPFVRSPYNYDRDKASHESGLDCSKEPSKTKQSFTEDADINVIVRRFALTGELPKNVRMPQYGDFTGITDFKSAMDAIAIAEESFYAMPANLRAKFDNNPEKFVAFCSDEKNREEAEKMGLVAPKPKQEAAPAQPDPKPQNSPQNAPKAPESKKD